MSLAPHVSRIKKGEFVLSTSVDPKTSKPKYHVTKVSKVLDTSVLGYQVKDQHKHEQQVEILLRDITANLGLTPPPISFGNAADFDAYFQYQTDHKHFGTVHWSFDPEEQMDIAKSVHKSFSSTYAWLKENGLQDVTSLPVVYEIHHKISKYAGKYWSSGGWRKKAVLRVSPMHPELKAEKHAYVIAHEVGHLIEFELLESKPKHRAKWMELYHETVSPLDITPAMCATLYDKLKSSPSLKDFRAAVSTDQNEIEAAKAIFEHLRRGHQLSAYDVETLLRAENEEQLKAVWPNPRRVMTIERKPMITEYSTKNVHELYAEAFAFLVCGKKLPARVTELLERSLELARKSLPIVLQEIAESNLNHSTDEAS